MTHRAYALVVAYGPETAVICTHCGLLSTHPRTKPAQAEAAAHNEQHLNPETP